MPVNHRIKQLAHQFDPVCWVSYSGKPVNYKRYMEGRRARSLKVATKLYERMSHKPRGEIVSTQFLSYKMSPLKISMMLHFYSVVGPFGPEQVRRSDAYVQFVRELLHAGMIERPKNMERVQHPGWAYRATAKGRVYVEALCRVPLPVLAEPVEPRWIMPASPETAPATGEGCLDGYARR